MSPQSIITIKRTHYRDDGVFGVFDHDGTPFAVSVELPWKSNLPTVSCIPEGEYQAKRVVSPHFGDVFEVTVVPNRTRILIHKANSIKDLDGCIGVGEQFESLAGITAVFMSQKAFDELMNRLKGQDSFTLVILKKS